MADLVYLVGQLGMALGGFIGVSKAFNYYHDGGGKKSGKFNKGDN